VRVRTVFLFLPARFAGGRSDVDVGEVSLGVAYVFASCCAKYDVFAASAS